MARLVPVPLLARRVAGWYGLYPPTGLLGVPATDAPSREGVAPDPLGEKRLPPAVVGPVAVVVVTPTRAVSGRFDERFGCALPYDDPAVLFCAEAV